MQPPAQGDSTVGERHVVGQCMIFLDLVVNHMARLRLAIYFARTHFNQARGHPHAAACPAAWVKEPCMTSWTNGAIGSVPMMLLGRYPEFEVTFFYCSFWYNRFLGYVSLASYWIGKQYATASFWNITFRRSTPAPPVHLVFKFASETFLPSKFQ